MCILSVINTCYVKPTTYIMFNCPAKPVSPYFFAITPAMRPQTARSTLYILKVLWITFSFSIASDICTNKYDIYLYCG